MAARRFPSNRDIENVAREYFADRGGTWGTIPDFLERVRARIIRLQQGAHHPVDAQAIREAIAHILTVQQLTQSDEQS